MIYIYETKVWYEVEVQYVLCISTHVYVKIAYDANH